MFFWWWELHFQLIIIIVDRPVIYMVTTLLIESSSQRDRQPHTSQHTDRLWGVVEEQWVLRGHWLCSPLPPKSPSLFCCLHSPTFPLGGGGDSQAQLSQFDEYTTQWYNTRSCNFLSTIVRYFQSFPLKYSQQSTFESTSMTHPHGKRKRNTSQQRALSSRSLESISVSGTGLCSSCQSSSGKTDCE